MVDPQKTGALIGALRREQGLTQAALGRLLGVADRTVSKWETGAGLPDVSVMGALADALGVTVDELLAGARSPRPQMAPEGVMEALRTPQARAALAQSTTPGWLRLVWGLASALFLGLAALCLNGWSALLGALSLLCGAQAVWCLQQRAALRRAWRGDRAPAAIRVDERGCGWSRAGCSLWFPHTALRRIDRWKTGYALLWAGGVAFVGEKDASWVALTAEKSGAAYRDRRKNRAPAWMAAGMVLCALLGWRARGPVEWALLYRSLESDSPVQAAESGNAAQEPRFSGSGLLQYAATDQGVWFTTDGGATLLSPYVSGAHMERAEDLVCGLASETALGAVYADGAGYSVSVSTDGGAHWNKVSLGELCRRAVWGTLQFPTDTFGYLALGTDFSMGTGKETRAWYTSDGGRSWQPYANLPQGDAQNILCGFCALPDGAAVLSLTTDSAENWPLVQVTAGDGVWAEPALPWDAVPLDYLHGVAGLERDGDAYVLTLTQQPFGQGTAVFRAPSMDGPWVLG